MEEFQQQRDSRPVLNNHLILDNVLQYLSYKDVCNFRLASMSSYQNSLRVWLDKAPCIQLYNTQQNIRHRRNYRGTIEEFLYQFHDGSRSYGYLEFRGIRQYKKFELNFYGSIIEHNTALNSFLATCGPWISSLSLENFHFEDLHTFCSVFYCVNTPHLKVLRVARCRYNFDASRQTLRESHSPTESQTGVTYLNVIFGLGEGFPIQEWGKFLSHYPNLKRLNISLPDDQVWNLFDAIRVIRAEGNKLALTCLHISSHSDMQYDDSNRLVAFYEVSKLPLTHLSIDGQGNMSPTHANSLISRHSSSLKSLYISCDDEHELWGARLDSTLPKVEGLRYLGFFGSVISNLKVLSKFANLTKLELDNTCDFFVDTRKLISASMEEDMSGVVFHSLKSFKYVYDEVCGPEKIQKIKSWMPNLTEVVITVTNDGFEEVCKSWPLLETIEVTIGLAGDDVLPVRELALEIPYQIPKHIANLTKLQKLDINVFNPWLTSHIRPRRLVAESLELEFRAGGALSIMRVSNPPEINEGDEILRNRNAANQLNEVRREREELDVVYNETLIQAQRLVNMSELFFIGGVILYVLAMCGICPGFEFSNNDTS